MKRPMHQRIPIKNYQFVLHMEIISGRIENRLMEKIKNYIIKNKEKIIKYFFIFLSVAISILIFIYRDYLSRLTTYGYLGIFLINLIGSATILIPTPALVATFVGGSIYNPLLVGILSGIGASIGETTGYLAGYGTSVLIKENKNNFSQIVPY